MYGTRSDHFYDPGDALLKAEYIDPVTNKTVYILEQVMDYDEYMVIRASNSLRETDPNDLYRKLRSSRWGPKDPLIVLPPIIQS